MKITVFASEKRTKEGKPFLVYSTRLINTKTGEEEYTQVKFVGNPQAIKKEDCPVIISFNTVDGNLAHRKFTDKEGVERTTNVLWLKNYTISDEKYVDHSLDDYATDM